MDYLMISEQIINVLFPWVIFFLTLMGGILLIPPYSENLVSLIVFLAIVYLLVPFALMVSFFLGLTLCWWMQVSFNAFVVSFIVLTVGTIIAGRIKFDDRVEEENLF